MRWGLWRGKMIVVIVVVVIVVLGDEGVVVRVIVHVEVAVVLYVCTGSVRELGGSRLYIDVWRVERHAEQ